MARNRNTSSFQGASRRRSPLPIISIVIVVILIALIALLWTRGGEQPQARIEKTIPAERLGQ